MPRPFRPPPRPSNQRTEAQAPVLSVTRCRAVSALVYELLDGELAPSIAAAVRCHLRGCAPCRLAVARTRALLDLVARAARIVPAPRALAVRVHAELASAEWGAPPRPPRRGAGAPSRLRAHVARRRAH